MSQKNVGRFIVIVGMIVVGMCLLADAIGIGGGPGFGMKQITGSLVGLAGIIVGILIIRRADHGRVDGGRS